MELPPGVHALGMVQERDGRDLEVCPTAVETGDGVLLVDVGCSGHLDALDGALAPVGGVDAVSLVLVTHHDGDHAGGLAELVDRTGATVLAHPAERPYLAGERSPLKGDPYPRATVDVSVVGGVTVPTAAGPLRVIETPGHSPGHCSALLPEEQLLIAGDALTAPDGALAGPNEAATPDLAAATRSVGRLGEYAVERTVAYHGGPVEAGTDRLREIHAALRERG